MTARPPRSTRALGGLAALLLTALVVTACSGDAGGGGDASDAGTTGEAQGGAEAGADAPAEAQAPAPEMADSLESSADRSQSESQSESQSGGDPDSSAPSAPNAEPVANQSRALIRTGTVALRAEDVARARFDVQKVVDANQGEVGEETTSADEDGKAEYARLVARVPSSRFAQTMEDLEGVADLITTDTLTEDVTTKVIDVGVRVRLQRRSIERISLLLERAGSLKDIIRIEQELARREADLGSLEQRQAFIDDQTSFSTITVSLERPAEKKKEEKPEPTDDTDDAGFLSGLDAGWDALGTATTGVLTVTGALLPFALIVLVLGYPAFVLVRRRTRGSTPSQPAPQAP